MTAAEYRIQPGDIDRIESLVGSGGITEGLAGELTRKRWIVDGLNVLGSVLKIATLLELSRVAPDNVLAIPIALALPGIVGGVESMVKRRMMVGTNFRVKAALHELVRSRGVDILDSPGMTKDKVAQMPIELGEVINEESEMQMSNLTLQTGVMAGGLAAMDWRPELVNTMAIMGVATALRGLVDKSNYRASLVWRRLNSDLYSLIHKMGGLNKASRIAKVGIDELSSRYGNHILKASWIDTLLAAGIPGTLALIDPTRLAAYLFLGGWANKISSEYSLLKWRREQKAPKLAEFRSILRHLEDLGTVIGSESDWAQICATNKLEDWSRSGHRDGGGMDDDYPGFDHLRVTRGRRGIVVGDFMATIGKGRGKFKANIKGPIFLESNKVHRVRGKTGEGKSIFMAMLAMQRKFDKGALYMGTSWGKEIFHMSYEEMREAIGYYSTSSQEFLKRPADVFGILSIMSGARYDYADFCEANDVSRDTLVESVINRFPFQVDEPFNNVVEEEIYWRFFGGRGEVTEENTENWLRLNVEPGERERVKKAIQQADQFLIYLAGKYLIKSELFNPEDAMRIAGTSYEKLSMGERGRLKLLQGLRAKHEVLIVDEVLENVDWAMKRRIAKKLREYAKWGKMVIVITHEKNADWDKLMGEDRGETMIVERKGTTKTMRKIVRRKRAKKN